MALIHKTAVSLGLLILLGGLAHSSLVRERYSACLSSFKPMYLSKKFAFQLCTDLHLKDQQEYLHLSGFSGHSGLAVADIDSKEENNTLLVYIKLLPVSAQNKDGNFNVDLKLSPHIQKVQLAPSGDIIWERETDVGPQAMISQLLNHQKVKTYLHLNMPSLKPLALVYEDADELGGNIKIKENISLPVVKEAHSDYRNFHISAPLKAHRMIVYSFTFPNEGVRGVVFFEKTDKGYSIVDILVYES